MCTLVLERGRQTDRQTLQDEEDDTLHSTCADKDGQGGRGERAEGQNDGMPGETGEARLHLADGDGELLQIQPVLSAASQ